MTRSDDGKTRLERDRQQRRRSTVVSVVELHPCQGLLGVVARDNRLPQLPGTVRGNRGSAGLIPCDGKKGRTRNSYTALEPHSNRIVWRPAYPTQSAYNLRGKRGSVSTVSWRHHHQDASQENGRSRETIQMPWSSNSRSRQQSSTSTLT